MWFFSSAMALAFHIGGLPARARYETPIDLGQVADQDFLVVWSDGDLDPTGQFNFAFQPLDGPPNAGPQWPWFSGLPIPNAQMVVVLDTVNQFVWDTSGVPAGSYIIYEVTVDPGIDTVVSVSPGPVTIRHPGDPLWPAVITDEPDGLGDLVGAAYATRWRATGAGVLTANVYYGVPLPNGLPDPDATPELLASGVAMTETSPGYYAGCYLWDVSALAEGFYWMLVEVVDEGGRSHQNYSRGMVIVNHAPGTPDAGTTGTCAEPTPDAAPGPDAGPGARDPVCTCQVGARTAGGVAASAGLLLASAVLAWLRRRRRR